MTPKEVKDHYKSLYRFNKLTGMSCSTLHNWLLWGYIPIKAQFELQQQTGGVLKARYEDSINKDK